MSELYPDYSSVNSLPEIWQLAAQKFGDITALHDPHAKPEIILSYSQLSQQIQQFAAGLQAMDIPPGAKVAIFADNSPRWFIADQGIMTVGAADVVRSSQAEQQELLYILQDSDSQALVVENLKTLKKLRPQLDDLPIELIILLTDETPDSEELLKILNFTQIMELGAKNSLKPVKQNKDNLATLIYTSGTTGKPKGVMLSHGNLMHQVNNLDVVIKATPGDRILSILPSWHSYERTGEYFLLSQGCTQIYTNIRSVKKDLKKFKPEYMLAVPRLWESIYEGVQKQFREQSVGQQKLINFFFNTSESYIIAKRIAQGLSLNHLNASTSERLLAKIKKIILSPLHFLATQIVYKKIREAVGGNIKTLSSGGGSLAMHLENFYEIIDIPLLVGYGLTETSPAATFRTVNHSLPGSSGRPIPETEIRIVDPETRQILPQGQRGLVLVRGPQVMQGYYKKPEATAKAIDSEGWFNSGDLGLLTPSNDLVLTGREKDTIVLTNGENIEPQPIEDACIRSIYIDQIMLVGQDQRSLGALIVPNLDSLNQWAIEQKLNLNLPTSDTPSTKDIEDSNLNSQPVQNLLRQELNREVKNRPGYRADDRIATFEFILEPFSIDNGMMTQTLKIRRPVVRERYHDIIDRMFAK